MAQYSQKKSRSIFGINVPQPEFVIESHVSKSQLNAQLKTMGIAYGSIALIFSLMDYRAEDGLGFLLFLLVFFAVIGMTIKTLLHRSGIKHRVLFYKDRLSIQYSKTSHVAQHHQLVDVTAHPIYDTSGYRSNEPMEMIELRFTGEPIHLMGDKWRWLEKMYESSIKPVDKNTITIDGVLQSEKAVDRIRDWMRNPPEQPLEDHVETRKKDTL